MVFTSFTCRVMSIWATLLTCYVAASELSSIQLEKQALLNSGWWSFKSNFTDHCKWYGFICNSAGSVTDMRLLYNSDLGKELDSFNFSCFPNLESLNLANNDFSGSIPSQIGALLKLKRLSLQYNHFTGVIPPDIGRLSNLVALDLSFNNLTGPIPSSLRNLTQLKYLDLSSNKLEGLLPQELGNLNNLTQLRIRDNNPIGAIPSIQGPLTNLIELNMSSNQLSGSIPAQIGAFPKLKRLSLQHNNFTSVIPPDIGRLSNLVELDLSFNSLIGPIPSSLCNSTHLEYLHLSSNKLEGLLPQELGNLKNLIMLKVSGNDLTGPIPPTLGLLTNLFELNMSLNQLSGRIPSQIGRLSNLVEFDLSYNNLTGPIPSSLCNSTRLEYLYLSSNKLEGLLPQELGNLKQLFYLNLSSNKLDGRIPSQLGEIPIMFLLDLSHNELSGTIPKKFPTESCEGLDLSFNNLEGEIPTQLQYCSTEEQFFGNKGLCGNVLYGFPSCPTPSKPKNTIFHQVTIFLPITAFLIMSIIGFLFLIKRKNKIAILKTGEPKNGDVFSIWNYDGRIAFEDMIEATEDFDIKYCIGTGAYGSVYKAQLPNDRVVALKKLHNSESEELTFLDSFQNEAHILSEIRHRNIVKLYGFCLHKRCMFLIYEYMERGSLFCILRTDDEAIELDWGKRVNIVRNIAHALSYLHHDCVPSIVHRDISSNNILLNSELEASVADFGLARLLNPDSSNRTILAGTYGYIAPVLELWH
ncbi:MDIS1-interacting receptor like kinase 2-like isoform X2 [Mangifera indica]|uniref:MDIS1-interacting receptor like kinase 2-like isoform X2 n=1 Tax=Mangifera indica TaxID=29780 RepID=UPI001CF995DD|nr:MDIS1-interacting receptor like kinase 2-like isoform X2 [Mangifera indica]